MNEILINAETIYNYLNIKENLTDSDLILGCGCMDTTIVEVCNILYKQLHSQKIIFSGKSGKGTIGKISSSEAQRFKNYAIELGMQSEKILLEEHARTTKENIKKSIKKVKFEKITIVHKPYVLKRCDQICKKLKINYQLATINLSFKEYINKVITDKTMTLDDIINELVGEIFILKHYRMFRISKVNIPKEVIKSYFFLKKKGYKKYAI